MGQFKTCELCNQYFNTETTNPGSNPHKCEPSALVARILALKGRLRSQREEWQPRQGCGHAYDCAVHNAPALELPNGPCDCGATREEIAAADAASTPI